ncbi:MAG: hypothetical protein HUU35_08105, partial [Armatimonadetes bacterium]|nr:hypothetical protein [Armatimonadota bacterium]
MFVRWQRRRLRGQFTLLLNGELSASQEARLRRCLATDPLLARELECFQRLLAELGQLPLASAPRALAAELQIELD